MYTCIGYFGTLLEIHYVLIRFNKEVNESMNNVVQKQTNKK